jgi:hypothetical protein
LRRRFAGPAYRGIELEVSHRQLASDRARAIARILEETLAELLR